MLEWAEAEAFKYPLPLSCVSLALSDGQGLGRGQDVGDGVWPLMATLLPRAVEIQVFIPLLTVPLQAADSILDAPHVTSGGLVRQSGGGERRRGYWYQLHGTQRGKGSRTRRRTAAGGSAAGDLSANAHRAGNQAAAQAVTFFTCACGNKLHGSPDFTGA